MSATRMDRIRRVSRVIKIGCRITLAVFALLVPVGVVIAVTDGRLPFADAGTLTEPSAADIAVALLATSVPLALALFMLEACARLFAAFEHGNVMVAASGRRLCLIGGTLIAGTIATSISTSATGAYLSARAGEGQLSITISSGDIFGIGGGLLLIVLGWVVSEAAELAREHAAIV